MPVYEYVCTTCPTRFEKLRPMAEMDDEAPCPDCGDQSSRALSVFAAFITDDYGNTRPTTNLGSGGGCACGAGGACACSAMGH